MSSRLSNAGLSDLFFNHEHPNYDKACEGVATGDTKVDDLPLRKELMLDAEEFIGTLAVALNDLGYAPPLPSAEQFADDFLARL